MSLEGWPEDGRDIQPAVECHWKGGLKTIVTFNWRLNVTRVRAAGGHPSSGIQPPVECHLGLGGGWLKTAVTFSRRLNVAWVRAMGGHPAWQSTGG